MNVSYGDVNDVYSKILGLLITLLFSQMKSAKRLKGILEAHPWNKSQKTINRQTHKPILRGLVYPDTQTFGVIWHLLQRGQEEGARQAPQCVSPSRHITSALGFSPPP